MPKNRVIGIPLGAFDSADLTADFQPLYAGGLPHALQFMRIQNYSTVDIIFSMDGITSNEIIGPGAVFEFPVQLFSQPRNQVAQIAAGSMLSVKWLTEAGTGNIYISGYYNAE
jgi:hypothetical protein